MTLRARWEGDPPRPGEFLMSAQRPRHSYRIVRVVPTATGLLLTVEREPVAAAEAAPPQGVPVWAWKWHPRNPRGLA